MSNLAVHYLPIHGRPSDLSLIRQVSNKLVKYAPAGKPDVNGLQAVWDCLDVDGVLILRNVAMSDQIQDVVDDPAGTAKRHAREWNEQLQAYPYLERKRVRIEGANEVPQWDGVPPSVIDNYNCVFADQMNRTGWLCVLGQINVGWPNNSGPDTPSNWQPFDGMLNRLAWDGNWLGLHEYFGLREGPRGLMAGWWAYRYRHVIDYCKRTGRGHPPIVITEMGGLEEVVHPDGSLGLNPQAGWEGRVQPQRYMGYLLDYAEDSVADGVIAATVFTTDGAHPWIDSMDTQGIHELWKASGTQTLGKAPEQNNTVHVPVVIVDGPDIVTGEPDTDPVPEPNAPADPDFMRIMSFILRWEGEELVTDSNGALAKYGINQAANPDVDVASLTLADAYSIYYHRYYTPSGAHKLNYPMSLAQMNAAVNTGVRQAWSFYELSGGSFGRYVFEQMDWYKSLAMYEQYGAAWCNRMIDLVDTAVTV